MLQMVLDHLWPHCNNMDNIFVGAQSSANESFCLLDIVLYSKLFRISDFSFELEMHCDILIVTPKFFIRSSSIDDVRNVLVLVGTNDVTGAGGQVYHTVAVNINRQFSGYENFFNITFLIR